MIPQTMKKKQARRNSFSIIESAVIHWMNILHSRFYYKRPNWTSPKDIGKEARKRTQTRSECPSLEKAKESF